MDSSQDLAQRLFLKGAEHLKSGESAHALKYFEKVQGMIPPNPLLFLYSGAALHALGYYDDAINTYKSALALNSDIGEIYNNLGNSLMAIGRFADAERNYSEAVRLLPDSPVPLTALSTAQLALGNIVNAESNCRKALSLAPEFAEAHWNLALNLLLQGHYSEGWKEYEWRWHRTGFTSPRRHADIKLWDGSNLNGRKLLLHAEQGFGDAIQFARYARIASERGGLVLIECHPQLVSLFKQLDGVHSVVPFGTIIDDVTYQAPLLSLPHIFRTDLATIPSNVPYLYPPKYNVNKWATIMTGYTGKIKAGIVWTGKSYPDPLRSCRLSDLTPLAKLEQISFFSLQLGEGTEQLSSAQKGMQLFDLTEHINDFSDTAALIEQLDLVISIDTAVAHLAGALGKPTFLLLPFAPDWRWLTDRNSSPWYPSVKLFRQNAPLSWKEPVVCLKNALDDYCSRHKKIL